ncbi:hypothetical protein JG687_00009361 [Phytophthora cactorum]|nr:hypothetical protein PC114_g14413 [Phytophthora cactorum]KAG2948390.1 hypothetical protein PC117_g6055 [Phytophthora cactorum]KAG3085827.1 hypothetical protein PC121_g5090 [Phytophthora cactorum]KAG3197215.1 hypothetical protein PC128_g6996 [Phytophthora cactorum]KAG6958489.1 hypothetical protein JG687_00009361 [Phytophthora cactorum]
MQSGHSDSGASAASSVKFPLPKDHFGQVNVSIEQTEEYRALVRRRIDGLIADEEFYAVRKANHQPRLDPTAWKFLRSHDEVKMFRRRRRAQKTAVKLDNLSDSIIALGRVPGSIEDLLYGNFSTTQEEAQTAMAYMHEPTDCALLRVLELDAPEDPLHYLGLKWMLKKMPMQALTTPRDACYLEAMGVEEDANKRRFGYMVLHSVDILQCPPFDRRRTDVIRGEVYFAGLFRETTPGFVDIMIRGIFDLSGDLPRHAVPLASMSFINGILKGVECAEAKKLTLLSRHNAVSGYNLDAVYQDVAFAKDAVCSVCIKRSKRLFSSTRLRACRVCGVAICSKCSAKNKRLFLGSERPCAYAVCCPNCVLEAQQMTGMRPCDPEYAVVADFYLQGPALESYSGALGAAVAQQQYLVSLSASEVDESDWWRDEKADTASVPDVVREVSPSGGERPTDATLDESWVGRDFMDGYASTLSDINGFASSAEEDDDYGLNVETVEQCREPPYEEELEVTGKSTSDALAALLQRAVSIGSQVQQNDSVMREMQRVQSRRLGV